MKMILGGKACDASNGAVLEVVNPANMQIVDTVPAATREDVETAVDAAREGFEEWRMIPLYQRIKILNDFTDLFVSRKETYAKLLCDSTGKTYRSCLGEVDGVAQLFRFFGEKARNFGGEVFAFGTEVSVQGDVVFTIREPLGIVVCIIPFNYPGNLFTNKVAPALLMGNAVIVKPTSNAPLDSIFITQTLLDVGVPAKTIQCITGSGSTVGYWLANSPKIDAISLTGSLKSGVAIAEAASHNLTKVMLELGGNDATIICDDADLHLAVDETIFGRVYNGGQTCAAPKRFFVDNKVKAQYIEMLKDKFSKIKVGDPYDADTFTGPLISEQAAKDVEVQVNHTIDQGAVCVYGGKRYDHTYFEPTILDGVTKDMDIARNMEVFGPVVPVVGFDTFEEALHMGNDTEYGLSGGIITTDMKKAFKAVACMDCGAVVINGSSFYRFDHQPFGGHKHSGIGNEGVSCTLEEMSQIKTVAFKKQMEI
jgi:succinate-semialdehyde dehydrogenase/glutarate-semialdehyde dehydrogenase